MPWTLQKNAEAAKTLEQLGVTSLSRSLASQTPDTLSITIPVQNADDDPLFDYGDTVRLKKNGIGWFFGEVLNPKKTIEGASEAIAYEVAGVWWWLEQIVFQQSWMAKNPDTSPGQPPTITVFSSRLNLCQAADGTRLTTGSQIREALQFAIDCGAPFQIGDILAGVEAPIREARDQTCAEVIRAMLRWSPDAVQWVDYSTAPLPTIHIKARATLAAVTVSLDSTDPDSFTIAKRSDLKVPAVLLQYEQTNSTDGSEWVSLQKDLYPVGVATNVPGAIIQTIELSGSRVTHQRQRVETQDLPSYGAPDWQLIAWFWDRCPVLQEFSQAHLEVVSSSFYNIFAPNQTTVDADGHTVTISDGDGNGVDYAIGDLPRELVRGTITDWMLADNTHLKAAKVQMIIQLSYKSDALAAETDAKIKADAKSLFHTEEKDPALQNVCEFRVDITATNATSKIYATIDDDTLAEPIPNGLAQALYTALAADQFEGSLRTVETEVGDNVAIGMGNVLNVLNSRVEYAAMRALVQSVSEDLLMGTRTLRFGPAAHLSPQDFIELLRSNRRSVPSGRLKERTTGQVSSTVSNSVGWTPQTQAANQPAAGGAPDPMLPWKAVVSGTAFTLVPGCLRDFDLADIEITGLDTPIECPSIGGAVWLKIALDLDTSTLSASPQSGYFSEEVTSNDSSAQTAWNQLLFEVGDPATDTRPGITITVDGEQRLLVQQFSRGIDLVYRIHSGASVFMPADAGLNYPPAV